MNEVTNYGTLLKKATVTLGEITSIDPPELSNPEVEITNHGSGGYREFIPSTLKEAGEFSFTMNYTQAAASGILADLQANTVASYSITFPNAAVCTFSGFIKSFKPESADAQSPNALTATVTMRPTGAMTIA